jgi:hypothetical protein
LEQHDLSQAAQLMNWKPTINFLDFLKDLRQRDASGQDVSQLWAPGTIPA